MSVRETYDSSAQQVAFAAAAAGCEAAEVLLLHWQRSINSVHTGSVTNPEPRLTPESAPTPPETTHPFLIRRLTPVIAGTLFLPHDG